MDIAQTVTRTVSAHSNPCRYPCTPFYDSPPAFTFTFVFQSQMLKSLHGHMDDIKYDWLYTRSTYLDDGAHIDAASESRHRYRHWDLFVT